MTSFSAPSASDPQICFIVGAPRSGTTWVQRLLQSHDLICGGEESHFFGNYSGTRWEAQKQLNSPRGLGPLTYMDQDAFDDMYRGMWRTIFARLYAEHPQALVHLEKTPSNALFLDEIHNLFPDARYIFLTRDSRAVTSPLIHAGNTWGDHWAPTDPRLAALMWRKHNLAMRTWRAQHPDLPVLELKYEDAVADTEAALARMIAFLIPDESRQRISETLQAYQADQAGKTEQTRKKDPSGFARVRGATGWQKDMTLWQKFVSWRFTRKLMRELGYDISLLS